MIEIRILNSNRLLVVLAKVLFGKLKGPAAGALRRAKWAEALSLAACLGLVPLGCNVQRLKKTVMKNQLASSRGNRIRKCVSCACQVHTITN